MLALVPKHAQGLSLSLSVALLLSLAHTTTGRTITIVNSCSSTIWPGMHTGSGNAPVQATGWELASGDSTSFTVDDDWTAGRIWGRTGCLVQNGVFQCLTGQCGDGKSDSVLCMSPDQPPATLAEFTLATSGQDNYDISLVDGFNIPMNIIPSVSSCPEPQCQVNINALCPPLLRTALDQDGHNLACLSSCNAGFGEELYGNRACCTGAYDNSTLCQSCGFDYYDLFKDNCNTSYAYAYDEKSGTALWTCNSTITKSDYTIEFCPANSDFVGPSTPSEEYVDATATCSSLATAFSATFSVAASPTSTATIGTLQVVATVATGVDGAAAIAINTATSSSTSGAALTATSVTSAPSATSSATSASDAAPASVEAATLSTAAATAAAAATTTSAADSMETSSSQSVEIVYVTTYIYDDDTSSATTTAADSATGAAGIVAVAESGSVNTDSSSSSSSTITSAAAAVSSTTTSTAGAGPGRWGKGQWLTAAGGHQAHKKRRLGGRH